MENRQDDTAAAEPLLAGKEESIDFGEDVVRLSSSGRLELILNYSLKAEPHGFAPFGQDPSALSSSNTGALLRFVFTLRLYGLILATRATTAIRIIGL
jgi:hypothetical protein